jgi:hypothetical protein
MLKGIGAEYLNECNCPKDTALVELWMVKVAANENSDIQDLYNDKNIAASDFHFNPVSLRVVQAMIKASTGLTTDNMFSPRLERLESTIEWALEEMFREYEGESKRLVKNHLKEFKAMMDTITELEHNDLD